MKKAIFIFAILLFAIGLYANLQSRKGQKISTIALQDQAKNTLQIGTFIPLAPTEPPPTPIPPTQPPPLPTPTQSTACNHDNGLPAVNTGKPFESNCECPVTLVECRNKRCFQILNDVSSYTCEKINTFQWCNSAALTGEGNGVYCLGKPVIYLYPKKELLVDVRVTMQKGEVVISDPPYNQSFHGWPQVYAYPDGTLKYLGKTYKELFYETSVPAVFAPQNGIVLTGSKLQEELTMITTRLGLIKNEQEEFLAYWLPKLYQLKSPYILFSLIDEKEKERIDHVSITPAPDTLIAFLAYFKPIQYPFTPKPLILPMPPKRIGFTAVEWGGTIDFE